MVEGPGATRNARKLQSVMGCIVARQAQTNQPRQQEPTTAALSEQLDGETLAEAFCVGKEVFLVFSNDVAIRLHFGMNGSLCLSKHQQQQQQQWKTQKRQYQPASLRLDFYHKDNFQSIQRASKPTHVMECFGTLVSSVSAYVARSKRERLEALDVCQEDTVFDASKVMEALQKRHDSMICDALLDQNKFPGVGNIIKIEGLHLAKVHPKRLVQNLSLPELKRVIDHCRDYARAWLQRGRAPPKKVYNETNCQTCHSIGSVRMVKLGQDLSRVTFWCEMCQPFSPPSLEEATRSRPPLVEQQRPILIQKGQQQQQQRWTNSCPQHGSKSFLLRRVRHKEENRNRLFGTCKIPGCPYFAWADGHFPNCTTCKRKTILRVSKTERSGGRWFFSCNTQACKGMFVWATPQQLEPLGRFLTPLL